MTVIGRAVDDLRPYLDFWLDEPDEAMLRQLAAFIGAPTPAQRAMGNDV